MTVVRKTILQSIGIDPNTIIYPIDTFNNAHDDNKYDYTNYEPSKTEDMYSTNILTEYCMFLGDYLNWGYWNNIDVSNKISAEQRIRASSNLYQYIFDQLSLDTQSHVLEVGFGTGVGLKKLLSEYKVASITGIDLVPQQKTFALKKNKLLFLEKKVALVTAHIENSGLPGNNYSHIFICEAAQHFKNMEKVLWELKRISKKGAHIVFVAPFPVNQKSLGKLREIIPNYDVHMSAYCRDMICKQVDSLGFKQLSCTSIGNHVFKGFDAWLSQQQETEQQWSRVYYPAYRHGLIDYYCFSLRTPV